MAKGDDEKRLPPEEEDEEDDAPAATASAPSTATPAPADDDAAPATPQATRRKSEGRERKKPAEAAVKAATKSKAQHPKAPNRPKLPAEVARLLAARRRQDDHRPLFVRQQAHRYYAIGRWETWRRPRGLQSKQRRHYGYRPTVVSIGFRSPRRVRGLTPSGFAPVVVRSPKEIEALAPDREAAVIARTVGTRKRLLLEEVARKRGVHVLNPLLHERGES